MKNIEERFSKCSKQAVGNGRIPKDPDVPPKEPAKEQTKESVNKETKKK